MAVLTSLHISAVKSAGRISSGGECYFFTGNRRYGCRGIPSLRRIAENAGRDPCSGLNIQADIIQQIFLTPDNAHFSSPGICVS